MNVRKTYQQSCQYLHDILHRVHYCYLTACKLKRQKEYNGIELFGYILNHRTDGLFIVLLQDTQWILNHNMGINLKLQLIYDYMEIHLF